MLVEVAELNGSAGNKDFWAKSRAAEAAILETISRLVQRPIVPNTQTGAHCYDFVTSHNTVGDIKIWSGSDLTVELEQFRNGRRWPGWFSVYLEDTGFAGLITANARYSNYHNREVFKVRWINWPSLINWVFKHNESIKTNSRGSYIKINPTFVKHIYIGDYFAVPSKYGAGFKAFDTSKIYCNNNLDIKELQQYF